MPVKDCYRTEVWTVKQAANDSLNPIFSSPRRRRLHQDICRPSRPSTVTRPQGARGIRASNTHRASQPHSAGLSSRGVHVRVRRKDCGAQNLGKLPSP